MILRIIDNDFHYECESLCRIFYPNEKIAVHHDFDGQDDKIITIKCSEEDNFVMVSSEFNIDGAFRSYEDKVSGNLTDNRDGCELMCAKHIFRALSDISGYIPPWGLLTGVRPSKVMLNIIGEIGKEEAKKDFVNRLLVSPEKTELAYTVAENEEKIISLSRPDSFSLYISIPFCPSRCSYCSFVSHSISNPNARRILPDYLDFLHKEIEYTSDIAKKLSLNLETIYIGGGTPGVLDEIQMDELLSSVENSFDLSKIREFTVEIGRPDTVTEEKLQVLKNHNVDRISINPQTFNQKTLDIIGRKHSIDQIFDAFEKAKKYNFKSVNMDLIAGLPEETFEEYKYSVDTAISLDPENITIHSLAMKRSSNLNQSGALVKVGNEAKKMIDYSSKVLGISGYNPYYMYRQSKCVGNLENVGWCKESTNGYYNVYMMEETHTVLACGAGAVSKLCDPYSNYVERIFNYKYPFEYISGFDTLLERKNVIEKFYYKLRNSDRK